jgi:hypothetical protein
MSSEDSMSNVNESADESDSLNEDSIVPDEPYED